MGRKHVTNQVSVISATGLAVTTTGTQTACEQLDEIRYEWSWANGSSLNAALTFQVSDDQIEWSTLDTGTFTLSGTSGMNDLYITRVIFKFIRPVITFTAGSGDVKVKIKGKTIAA